MSAALSAITLRWGRTRRCREGANEGRYIASVHVPHEAFIRANDSGRSDQPRNRLRFHGRPPTGSFFASLRLFANQQPPARLASADQPVPVVEELRPDEFPSRC